jgi:hypothetical protein
VGPLLVDPGEVKKLAREKVLEGLVSQDDFEWSRSGDMIVTDKSREGREIWG